MSHFAAFSPTASDGLPDQIPTPVLKARAALNQLAAGGKIQEFQLNQGGWVFYPDPGDFHLNKEQVSIVCLPVGTGLYDPLHGERITPEELARRFTSAGANCLTGLAPPAGGCFVDTNRGGITAFTDRYGLQHIYYSQNQDGVVIGSSALLVALASGDRIDLDSFGVFGLLGHHLGEECGFQNTRRLPAGSVIRLHDGHCQIESYAPSPKDGGISSQIRTKLAQEGADILRTGVYACLSAFPEVDLELSGGLDSRLLLAAIHPTKRRGLRAITRGEPGSHDWVTAKLIADHDGMPHLQIDLSRLGMLPAEEIFRLIKRASFKVGHNANPFGRGVLDWVNSQVDQHPRLSGQNGEYIRGFYYPGQPDAGSVNSHLVNSLARWRMWTNQGVDQTLLTPAYREQIESSCLTSLSEILRSYRTGWLLSTDEFYLKERMGRWVGLDYSAASLDRVVLAPFFHPAFVEWAGTIPPIHRRGSSLSAAMLEMMDPYLATLPLDGGTPARDLAQPSLKMLLSGKFHFAAKVARKAWQRVTGHGKPPYGAETLYRGLLRNQPGVLDLLPHVQHSGIMDSSALNEVFRGQRKLDWKSLGFLLNLEWTYEYLESGGSGL